MLLAGRSCIGKRDIEFGLSGARFSRIIRLIYLLSSTCISKVLINKTSADQFHYCCKNWTLNLFYCYCGQKKKSIFRVFKVLKFRERKMKNEN